MRLKRLDINTPTAKKEGTREMTDACFASQAYQEKEKARERRGKGSGSGKSKGR
eukprot:m.272931 g.272931  ORF g.272931 m.272931 type:complete len:54 (+) comp92327_c0_seq1:208-369(+)